MFINKLSCVIHLVQINNHHDLCTVFSCFKCLSNISNILGPSNKIFSYDDIILIKGDSTRTEPNDLSSESDFDPSTSHTKLQGRRKGEKKSGNTPTGLKFTSFSYESGYEDCEHKSAFLPYKVTKNLQHFFQ